MTDSDADVRTERIGLGATLAVLAVALLLRLWAHGGMAAEVDTFAPIIDAEAYVLQALRVAAGAGLAEGVSFQAPLYPWLLGQVLGLAGFTAHGHAQTSAELPPEVLSAVLRLGRALNLILGLVSVWLLLRLAETCFGRGPGLAAGLLAAACQPFIFYEGLLLKGSLSLLWLPAVAWVGVVALRRETDGRPTLRLWLLAGVLLGLGGLVRGNLHLVSWLAGAALAARGLSRGALRQGLLSAAALGAGVALALLPMVVRNSAVAGQLVLSTAAGGTAFYLCNHPDNDTGLIQVRALNRQVPRHELSDWTAEAEQRTGRTLSSAQVSNFWFREALAGIAERPGTWVLAQTRKLFLLFSRYEAPDNSMPSFGDRSVAALRWLPVRYGLLVPLAAAGVLLAWHARRRRPDPALAVLLFLAAAYGASLLPFVVTSRFRLPLLPLAIVLASVLLGRLRELAQPAGRSLRLPVVAALAGGWLLTLVSESPLGPLSAGEQASHLAVCLRNRAQLAAGREDFAAADADLLAAVSTARAAGRDAPVLHAERARFVRLAALRLAEQGRPDQAAAGRAAVRAALDEAFALDGESPAAWRESGLLAYDEDDPAAARAALLRSLEREPRDRESLQYLALSCLAGGQFDEAEQAARRILAQDERADEAHGLLALALLRQQRTVEARAALAQRDALVAQRRAVGLPPRLPELPEFAALRAGTAP